MTDRDSNAIQAIGSPWERDDEPLYRCRDCKLVFKDEYSKWLTLDRAGYSGEKGDRGCPKCGSNWVEEYVPEEREC